MSNKSKSELIDRVVDEYYDKQGAKSGIDILKRIIVKQSLKDKSTEWAKNNVWVKNDIEAIKTHQKAKRR